MKNADYKKYILDFKQPSGTSRGVMTKKETYFLRLEENGNIGYGECGLFKGLSVDDRPDYEEKLQWLCRYINDDYTRLMEELTEFPSLQFGLETALQSLKSRSPFLLFLSDFTKGKKAIPINGLVWMGKKEFMKAQIEEKLKRGFSCIKLKIGALDFEEELELIDYIRNQFPADRLEIRVDANGGFTPQEALSKLETLSKYHLHSIEQPIKQGQWKAMERLCKETPLPIALDEELIGVFQDKEALLKQLNPQYIILKPSLIGGFSGMQEWIDLAEKTSTGWWVTSALESNIGLNAIAQWTFLQETTRPQGLGTGQLYTNNIDSPLEIKGEHLAYNPEATWATAQLQF